MAGRKEGATNLKKREFRQALLRYCADKHVDPFFWMVDLLTKKRVKNELKLQAAKELAQYLQPKLRAIELTGEDGGPMQVQHDHLHQLTAALDAALEEAYGHHNGHRAPPHGVDH